MDVRRSVRGGRNRHVRQRRRGGGGGNGGKVVVVHARNGVNGNEGSGKAEMGVRRQNLARRRGEVTTTTSAVMVAREASEETKIKRKEVKKTPSHLIRILRIPTKVMTLFLRFLDYRLKCKKS